MLKFFRQAYAEYKLDMPNGSLKHLFKSNDSAFAEYLCDNELSGSLDFDKDMQVIENLSRFATIQRKKTWNVDNKKIFPDMY